MGRELDPKGLTGERVRELLGSELYNVAARVWRNLSPLARELVRQGGPATYVVAFGDAPRVEPAHVPARCPYTQTGGRCRHPMCPEHGERPTKRGH